MINLEEKYKKIVQTLDLDGFGTNCDVLIISNGKPISGKTYDKIKTVVSELMNEEGLMPGFTNFHADCNL